MPIDEAVFWDTRYQREGAVWGEGPSPSAVLAAKHLAPGARVLDVGFGYGRDLAYLSRLGHRVHGVDLSGEGRRQAARRLEESGLPADTLLVGAFQEQALGDQTYDLVLSHRVVHLLLTRDEIACFAGRARQLLDVGGLLCVGARNPDDLDPDSMIPVRDGVYEYRDRPGHRIRYWGDDTFREAFGGAFDILALERATEEESRSRPLPCHLTVLLARKREK
jgi:SAM-dependent methyltransferase